MINKTIRHGSKNKPKRKLSVSVRKKIVQYWLSGLKTETQLFQEYGINLNLLWQYHRWYHQHYLNFPYSSKKEKIMTDKEKIKALEKRNRELEKSLAWERIKSQTFETAIKIAEEEFNLDIRKKFGAEQSKK